MPGYYKYKTEISSLKPEQQSEECPICFTPINLAPGEHVPHTDENNGSDHQTPLVENKLKHCYSTPCGHNFHKFCLLKWYEKKPDCPSCRKALPYME